MLGHHSLYLSYVAVVRLANGMGLAYACMVIPLGSKNISSPSNQVVALISCTCHKQIIKFQALAWFLSLSGRNV